MARIGIYGGSFNPPHIGHTTAAAALVSALALDRLLVVPAAQPPHKTLAEGSPSAEERAELVRLAFAAVPKAELCTLELAREGPSYTVDTLLELKAQLPDDELFLIMGTDMLLSFASWYQPGKICELAALAVMRRSEDEAVWTKVRQTAQELQFRTNARVEFVKNDCIEVSSTTVRRLLALNAPAFLDPAVEARIKQQGLYQYGADRRGLPFERLREVSLALHDEKRRPHVVGCSDTAVELAAHWGEDTELARRAGILHDVTKALKGAEQVLLCDRFGVQLSELERQNPKLLHARTGAAVAEQIFGEPPEVVSAIRWHTTGRADMTTLEKIIYLADYMEPNRSFDGVQTLRRLVREDLNAAMVEGLAMSIELLRRRRSVIDQSTLDAWRYYATERSLQP